MATVQDHPTDVSEALRFLARHQACADSLPWAGQFHTLEELWQHCPNPDWLLWGLKYTSFQDPMAMRRWACRCVRRVWDWIGNDTSRHALEVAERFTRNEASPQELTAAWQEAAGHVGGPWPSAPIAWATRAGAEAAGERVLLAAKAAAEAAAWHQPEHYAGAWAAVRAAQADLLREVIGAEGIAAVIADWRKASEDPSCGPLTLEVSRPERGR